MSQFQPIKVRETVRSGGAGGWLFQRISGVVLAVVLVVHFFVQHFSAGAAKGINYASVAARLSQPWYKAFAMLFLAFALWHGMYGLWLVIEDYVHTSWKRMLLYGLLWTAGIVALGLGAITVIPFTKAA